jgi:hypothetical protein
MPSYAAFSFTFFLFGEPSDKSGAFNPAPRAVKVKPFLERGETRGRVNRVDETRPPRTPAPRGLQRAGAQASFTRFHRDSSPTTATQRYS